MGVSTFLGVGWLVAVGLVYLAPALAHGTALGPYDLLTQVGLGRVPGVTPHNPLAGDQIQQDAVWAFLNWQQVHRGILPLWNPYNGLGLPLAFDFQSAPFGLPALVSYLFPVSLAYTVQVVMRLVIAGTGGLVLGRTLRLGVVASTFGATVFELSGAFTGWLGWPMGDVLCWLGWVLAGALLLLRGVRPRRSAALLAVSLGFAVYGGHPESLAILLFTLALVVVVLLVISTWRRRSLRPALLPLARVVMAAVAGLALAAPLLLPALQVTTRSARATIGPVGYAGLPVKAAVDFVFSGFYGFPTSGSVYFGPVNWYETAAYVGVIALALAALALVSRWRDREVGALGITAVLLAAIVFVGPVAHLVGSLPVAGFVNWGRLLIVLDMLLGVLAGVGLQALLDGGLRPAVSARLAAVSGLGVLVLAVLGVRQLAVHAPPAEAAVRAGSFLWPSVQAGVLAIVAAALILGGRRSPGGAVDPRSSSRWLTRGCAAALVAAEAAFLLTAAPGLWSSSPRVFSVTPAEARLQALVGTSRVGFSACPSLTQMADLGILPDANGAYGVAELAVYDPIYPESYLSAWSAASGAPQPSPGGKLLGMFCPSVSSAALARRFGVAYILTPPGTAAPPGTHRVATLDGEGLYRVPGAGLVTLQPGSVASGRRPGTAVPTAGANPASLHLRVDAAQASTLEIHVTDLPGWTATMDGRPLALRPLDGAMLQATVPPGAHSIALSYWPPLFSAGLGIGAIAALGLVAMGLVDVIGHRRSRRGPSAAGTTATGPTAPATVPPATGVADGR